MCLGIYIKETGIWNGLNGKKIIFFLELLASFKFSVFHYFTNVIKFSIR